MWFLDARVHEKKGNSKTGHAGGRWIAAGLAARFETFYDVVAGTTLGMMLANIPAVILGDRLAERLPLKAIRYTAAVVFAAVGVFTLSKVRM